jgi:hypothetical protein
MGIFTDDKQLVSLIRIGWLGAFNLLDGVPKGAMLLAVHVHLNQYVTQLLL